MIGFVLGFWLFVFVFNMCENHRICTSRERIIVILKHLPFFFHSSILSFLKDQGRKTLLEENYNMWKDYQSPESSKRKVLYKRDNRFLASVKKAFLVMNAPPWAQKLIQKSPEQNTNAVVLFLSICLLCNRAVIVLTGQVVFPQEIFQ